MALLVSDKSNSVTLSFNKNRVYITSSAPDVGEAKEDVPVKYNGKEINVAFNPEFLMDPLKNMTAEELSFELGDEFMRQASCAVTRRSCMCLMPMRVK